MQRYATKAFGFLAEAAVGVYLTKTKSQKSPHVHPAQEEAAEGAHGHVKGSSFIAQRAQTQQVCSARPKNLYRHRKPDHLVISILPLATVLEWASNAQTATEYDVLAVAYGEASRVVNQRVLPMRLKHAPQLI